MDVRSLLAPRMQCKVAWWTSSSSRRTTLQQNAWRRKMARKPRNTSTVRQCQQQRSGARHGLQYAASNLQCPYPKGSCSMGASQISGGNFWHGSLRSMRSCSSAHQCPASSVLLHPASSVLQSPAPSVQSPRGHRGVSFGVVGQDSGRVALHSEGSHSMLSATSAAGTRSTCTRQATALPASTKQQAIGVGTCASSTTTVWSIGIFAGSHSRRIDQCSP